MVVSRQGSGDAFVVHGHKGKAVGQGPFLVGPLFKQGHAALEEARVGRNDIDARMVEERAVEGYEISPILRITVGIPELSQHPFGGDQTELRVAGKLGGLRMLFLAGVEQREELERVGEGGGHFFGSPRT
jgi:hypothetical protein